MAMRNTTVDDVIVSSTKDGFSIPCKIWRAQKTNNNNEEPPTAAALFIHGGIFARGDLNSHPAVSRALSETLDMIIITASFRCGDVAPHRTGTSLQDLMDVSRYFRSRVFSSIENKGTTDKKKIPFGVIGSSSGGYFALALATQNADITFDFCIPICPVAHPNRRALYLKACISGTASSDYYRLKNVHTVEKAQFILDTQISYWETEEAMEEAGESLRLRRDNINNLHHPPPTLLIMGSADKNVPMYVCEFIQAWATRTIIVGGAGHEIQDVPPVNVDDFQTYLWDIHQFLTTLRNKNQGEN